MTVPISNQIVSGSFNQVWDALGRLRADCLNVQSSTAGGVSVGSNIFLSVAQSAVIFRTIVSTMQANTTLWTAVVAFAGEATATAGLSAADFTATYNSAGALLTALSGEYPHNAQGVLLDRTFSLTLGIQLAVLSAAQMPNTMTAISNFLATVS